MFVYADNAATTSVSKTALDAMLPYLTENYGNPSSLYAFAQKATEAERRAQRDLLHLRRQRGRQPGHHLRRQGGGTQGQKAPDLHQI